MHRLALIGALLLLGGCNMVITQAPLFTTADEAGAPPLRPGVWASTPDASCVFDERTPVSTWPSCANGGVTRDGSIGGFHDDGQSKSTLTMMDDVVAAGDPRVLQLHVGEAAPSADLSVSGYFYIALRATKTDDQGRITAMTSWPVLCGPPPPNSATTSGKMEFGTKAPFPGLVMDQDKTNCTTTSQAALRHAASASEQYSAGVSPSHWVRDGEQ